jgi:hypothetical protein
VWIERLTEPKVDLCDARGSGTVTWVMRNLNPCWNAGRWHGCFKVQLQTPPLVRVDQKVDVCLRKERAQIHNTSYVPHHYKLSHRCHSVN